MAFRLKLVPEQTNINFFGIQWLTFGASIALMVASIVIIAVMGLNFGVDFQGGTTIRTESVNAVDVGAYRQSLTALNLGDATITEVTDPTFRDDQHVAQIRIGPREGEEAVTPDTIQAVEDALKTVDPAVTFTSVESVGPKVSGELIQKSVIAVVVASIGILIYVWLRFEWQMAVGSVASIVHDVLVTVGIFSLFQIKFDLNIVAALLTILGYSMNDCVVVFDRLRENLAKYKKMSLFDHLNLSANEMLSRTVMTGTTTILALLSLLIWGGDVLRGFAFAMILGVVLGTYSTLYMAKNIVLILGLDRSDKKKKRESVDKYSNIGK